MALLSDVQLSGAPLGFAFAVANAALFALYIVLAHRASAPGPGGRRRWRPRWSIAAVVVTPLGGWQVLPALA